MAAILLLLVSACLVSVGSASNAAGQLVYCVDKLHHVSASTSTVEVTELYNECYDAIDYYSQTDLRINEIRPIWNAVWTNFKDRAIGTAKGYLERFTRHLLNQFFDEKTNEMILTNLKHVKYIYEAYYHGKVEVQLVQRTVERLAVTTLLVNPATTKATKWAAKLGKYSNHVGIIADVAEYGMGVAGYESEGKVVGAVGNTASGAMMGFSVAGPPGAAIGGALGFLMWCW